jgi:hypothetical protein
MFKVIITKEFIPSATVGSQVNVYSIRDDTATGYPQFLVYIGSQWMWKSASISSQWKGNKDGK